MKTIYKFEIKDPYKELQLPKGYEILSVQVQRGIPCIWILVDIENKPEKITLLTFLTGEIIREPEKLKYIGTYQLKDGDYIFHVFQKLN